MADAAVAPAASAAVAAAAAAVATLLMRATSHPRLPIVVAPRLAVPEASRAVSASNAFASALARVREVAEDLRRTVADGAWQQTDDKKLTADIWDRLGEIEEAVSDLASSERLIEDVMGDWMPDDRGDQVCVLRETTSRPHHKPDLNPSTHPDPHPDSDPDPHPHPHPPPHTHPTLTPTRPQAHWLGDGKVYEVYAKLRSERRERAHLIDVRHTHYSPYVTLPFFPYIESISSDMCELSLLPISPRESHSHSSPFV